MSYTKAADVNSPKGIWTLLHVLVDGGESTDSDVKWSFAIGRWNNEVRLAMRWNGTKEKPAGNPQSRGIATWFILPPEADDLMTSLIPAGARQLVDALRGK